ncbi:excalibur calcium-binding domain-containing protein [Nocardia uniformis]|uniref:excalibur calcium-binding domain-containing protein n=1 Tax=Nocardia uniformis TaxID=53432 RepID=UPI003530F10D
MGSSRPLVLAAIRLAHCARGNNEYFTESAYFQKCRADRRGGLRDNGSRAPSLRCNSPGTARSRHDHGYGDYDDLRPHRHHPHPIRYRTRHGPGPGARATPRTRCDLDSAPGSPGTAGHSHRAPRTAAGARTDSRPEFRLLLELRRRPSGRGRILHRGEPGYRSGLDRDNDGIACE